MSDAIRTLMFSRDSCKALWYRCRAVCRPCSSQRHRQEERSWYHCGVLVKRIDDGLIWRGVADVVKIEHGDVLAAQKIQKLFGVFLVCAVSRNEPGIDPEVGSLLRNRVGEIGVGLYGGGCLAGVDER